VVLFQEQLDFLKELGISRTRSIQKGARIRRVERLKIELDGVLPALVIHSRTCGITG
jgi:hypothetical protein